MYKKAFYLLLTGVMLFLCSCVDATYDLSKEISTEVEIKDNKLSLPLGSLRAFMIDSLMTGIELIETTEDGSYCIKNSDELCVEKFIHPISIDIPSQSIVFEKEITANNSFTRNSPAKDTIPMPFNVKKEISFNNKIYKQFKRIYSCSFKEETLIQLNLKLDGLSANSANLDFSIDFPLFMNDLRSEDEGVKVTGNHVDISKKYIEQNEQGLTIKLYCSGFDFEAEKQEGLEPETAADGNTYLSYQSTMTTNGLVEIECNSANLSSSQSLHVALKMDISFDPITIQAVDGVFYEEFYKVIGKFSLDLEDLSTTIEEANAITLAEPYIETILTNTITIPIEHIELDMLGKDKEGDVIPGTAISTTIDINPAKWDETNERIIPDTTKLLLTSSKELTKEGFQKIETPELQQWFEKLPDSICYSVHPILNTSKRADIRIDQALNLTAAYKTVIPLSFKELNLSFGDTIAVSLGETMEMFSNAGLALKMNIANTIPLGMSIIVTALDENYSPIDDIHINAIKIEPCKEENSNLQTTQNKKRAELSIKSSNGNDLGFSEMEYLKFDLEVFTENNTIALKNTQGIQISDISIEISGDINSDLK